MTETKLRWGVISTANIGRAAVNPAIKASRNGELLAVASRDEERAREFADKWEIPQHYGSYDALLDDASLDAVYIPLPNSMHCEWTIRAAERGKHILCEKPLALDADECREMDAAAEANGVKLMEAFMYRFHPRTQKMVEMVRAGVVGDLKLITSAFTFRLNNADNVRLRPEMGGGSLMDVGCYCVNVSRTIAGAEPVAVQAVAHQGPSGVDEQMVGTLRFEDGLLAQFDSALNMVRRESCLVAGTDAYLTVPSAFLPGTDDVVIQEHGGRDGTTEHTVAGVDEYRLMVEHFADCVLNDRAVRYSAEEAALNMTVIAALYESARRGGEIVEVRV